MISEHRKAKRRIYNERRRKERIILGLKNNIIPTNEEKIEGFEKHHIIRGFVISLPSFIHREVPHGFDILNSGMEETNEIALNYLLGHW